MFLQQVVADSMPSSRIREIPIFREADKHQPHPSHARTASPANFPPAREIPIQRDSGIGSRPLSDFFHHQERSWGDPWPNQHNSLNSDMFDSEPFSHSSGFRSRAGFPGFPSHVGNDFRSDRRSPVQKPFSKHPDDRSSPRHVESPVTTSHPPEQPVAAEATPVLPADQPKPTVPIFVEPAVSDASPSAIQTEAKNDATDASQSLHVEEPAQRARSPSPIPPNMTPLEIIEQVMTEAAWLKGEVELYTGGRKEKPYLRLEELLTRLMLKLDRIESEGRDDIRNARREAVRTVQSILELLESRTSKMAAREDLPSTKFSVVPENSSSDATIVGESTSETKMETSGTTDNPTDSEQTKNNVDAAAVKEMVLGSEVPC